MLLVTGRVLDVDSRIIGNPGQQFESITVSILTGKASIERVRLGRDFPTASMPRENDLVVYGVAVSAYAGKNGAGVSLTALSDLTDQVPAIDYSEFVPA